MSSSRPAMTPLGELLDHAVDGGDQTVPMALLGCWRRNWIQFGDGNPEYDVAVIWLQTASGMGDIRIDPAQRPDQTDSSCGITIVDETTTPFVTADWIDGESGFAQQLEPSFPEKGWLSWNSDTILRELAPSGAYVEEWEKLDDSDGIVAHFVASDAPTATNLYVAGRHVFLAIHRSGQDAIHRFSYGTRSAESDAVVIELSTLADRLGKIMDLDLDWHQVSCRRT